MKNILVVLTGICLDIGRKCLAFRDLRAMQDIISEALQSF